MFGLGTLINMGAILLGGLVGRLVGKAIPKRFQDMLYMVCGISTLFIGIGGCLQHMLIIEAGALNTQGTMMMLLSLTIGSVLGEWINLEMRLEQFGEWLKRKTGNAGDATFIDAFVRISHRLYRRHGHRGCHSGRPGRRYFHPGSQICSRSGDHLRHGGFYG